MTPRRIAAATLWLTLGYAVAAALFWALLNVPESSVLALALSATLVAAVALVIGFVSGTAAAVGDGTAQKDAVRQGLLSIPAFLAGLLLAALLWRLTGAADAWWRVHRGEIDAVFLRYLAATRTSWLHQTVLWTVWGVRWVLGVSLVSALTAAGTLGTVRAMVAGSRSALRAAPLLVSAAAVAVVSGGVGPVLYWRPRTLPPDAAEPVFIVAKLLALYLVAAVTVALVLTIQRRIARTTAAT